MYKILIHTKYIYVGFFAIDMLALVSSIISDNCVQLASKMWVISQLENIHHFDSIQIFVVLRIGKSFWLNFSYANVHNLINYMNHLHKLSEFNRHDAITHFSQVNKWIGKKGALSFVFLIHNDDTLFYITKIRGGIYFVYVLSPFFSFH